MRFKGEHEWFSKQDCNYKDKNNTCKKTRDDHPLHLPSYKEKFTEQNAR